MVSVGSVAVPRVLRSECICSVALASLEIELSSAAVAIRKHMRRMS